MKCSENGGCPFLYVRESIGKTYYCCVDPGYTKDAGYELRYNRCHLQPASFPIIKAMIAGEATIASGPPTRSAKVFAIVIPWQPRMEVER